MKNIKNKTICILSVIILCVSFSSCKPKEIPDGTYSVDVTLEGGSGRSSIEDAAVEISGGEAVGTIVWSSPYYEYMIVDDVRYEPINTEGNSTFEIPVVLDEKMEVSASTVAMSQPHLIDYTLFFDSGTLKGE